MLRILAFHLWCYLCGLEGAKLCLSTFGEWQRQRILAEHPGEYICGLFAMPYMFFGFLTGAVVGGVIWFGGVIWWRHLHH